MRDRQRDQQAVVGAHVVHRDRRLGVVDVIVVGARDQLGHAGGAARQLEDARLVGIDLDGFEQAGLQLGSFCDQFADHLRAEHRAHFRMRLANRATSSPESKSPTFSLTA